MNDDDDEGRVIMNTNTYPTTVSHHQLLHIPFKIIIIIITRQLIHFINLYLYFIRNYIRIDFVFVFIYVFLILLLVFEFESVLILYLYLYLYLSFPSVKTKTIILIISCRRRRRRRRRYYTMLDVLSNIVLV